MRMRFKPWAGPELAACDFHVGDPAAQKGNWRGLFARPGQPLYVEPVSYTHLCMHDAGVGYGSINHPVDRDPICGYVGVIGEVCPRCGRREGEALTQAKIDELKKQYPEITTFCGCT